MTNEQAADRFAGLDTCVERLRRAAVDLMGSELTSMTTWADVWFARHVLKGVGDAVDEVLKLVAHLEAVRDLGWAVAARPALFSARCRAEEASWAISVVVGEWERPLPSHSPLPADAVATVREAMADATRVLERTRKETPLAELDAGDAEQLVRAMGRILGVAVEVVAALEAAPVEAAQAEVCVTDVHGRLQAARGGLALAAAEAGGAGEPADRERWVHGEVRGYVLAVKAHGLNAAQLAAVVAGGIGNWLDEENGSRRVMTVAKAIRSLEAILGGLQARVSARWPGSGERTSAARVALTRAATLLGFASGKGVVAPSTGGMSRRLIGWRGAVSGLALPAADGSAVAYAQAVTGESPWELVGWYGEILDALYAIAPCTALIGTFAEGAHVPSLMSQAAQALAAATDALEQEVAAVEAQARS